jgi:hypothetical protein
VTSHPLPYTDPDACSDCGAEIDAHHAHEDTLCPACFEKQLYGIDAGFLENYRKFGCRSRLTVAETCLRGLVLAAPDTRKILAMTIFEQYVLSMSDLAGLFLALRNREQAPIMKSFMEFKLDPANALDFFESVQNMGDYQLCAVLGLPMPFQVEAECPHLDDKELYEMQVALHHLVQDLRKATDKDSALYLAQFASAGSSVIASSSSFLPDGSSTTPDQVAMLVLDSKRRSLMVQGLTAEEGAMAQVIDAIDTVTRAGSNLIYAYLQSHNL